MTPTNIIRLSNSFIGKKQISLTFSSLSPCYLSSYHQRSFSSSPKQNQQQHLVINAVGVDRPGIVSDLTKIVTETGGNVGKSQASKLGSHFGLMMLITLPSLDASDSLRGKLEGMEGMDVGCFVTNEESGEGVTPKVAYSGKFTVSGIDNVGIVHKITSKLASYSLSIDSMETHRSDDVPFGGTTLFTMDGTVRMYEPMSKSFNEDALKEEFIGLGDELNCDVTFEKK